MLQKLLPEYIAAYQSASQELELKGEVKLANMPRLAGMLQSADGLAQVRLHFTKDQGGVTVVSGEVEAALVLECQRCLGPYIYPLQSKFNLGVVDTPQQADALPGSYEPIFTQEGNIAIWELLEDELILNLPIVPKHDPKACEAELPRNTSEQEEETRHPFKVLASLKEDKGK